MPSVEPMALAALKPYIFGRWTLVLGGNGEHQHRREYPMVASCHSGQHVVWLLNVAAGRAFPEALPLVQGNLVPRMHFIKAPGNRRAYDPVWRGWVRAMFLPRLFDHVPDCVEGLAGKAAAMANISTVGTFELGGAVYAVEWHPGEIRVTDAEGADAAVMQMDPDMVLLQAAPGAGSAPAEVLDLLWERTRDVMQAAAEHGRGPWATLPELPRA